LHKLFLSVLPSIVFLRFISTKLARKKPDASHQAFFNEARLAAHEACYAHEAMLRIMKNEFSPARFASCPKDASYCASNASFSPKFFDISP
jgi:hypothetical protein